MGGVGNQLFQYALGRCMMEKTQNAVVFDISAYEKNMKRTSKRETPRIYALGHFKINVSIAGEEDRKSLLLRISRILSKKIARARLILGLSQRGCYYLEREGMFDQSVISIEGDAYVEGYWQKEKYFKEVGHILHEQLKLRDDCSVEGTDIARKMRSENSVSLHVRRGDYVYDKKNIKNLGTCSADYYSSAICYMANNVSAPRFYVFADDIEWAKQNINIEFPVWYVSEGTFEDFQELMLMSYCKHNIIANSSFSWWGAWLNKNPEKIVIAPRKWFNKKDLNSPDRIPEKWIRL